MDKITRPKTSPKKWICIKKNREKTPGSYKGEGRGGDNQKFLSL